MIGLKQIFTWWNRNTLGTFLKTLFFGKLVGKDELGNKYYKNKKDLQIDAFNEYNNGTLNIVYHDLSHCHHFKLTWKCRDLLEKQIPIKNERGGITLIKLKSINDSSVALL